MRVSSPPEDTNARRISLPQPHAATRARRGPKVAVTLPADDVASTREAERRRPITSGSGCPNALWRPTDTTTTRGSSAASSAGEDDVRLP